MAKTAWVSWSWLILGGPAWAQGTDNPECLGSSCGRPGEGFVSWPSAIEHGTVTFEDLWPSKGDSDYNDLTLRVHVERTADVSDHTLELRYTFLVWSIGATRCAAAGLRLPGDDPSNVTVERVVGAAGATDGGEWTTTSSTVVSDGAAGSIVPLTLDARTELCAGAPGYLNTQAGSDTVACAPVGLRITFTTPSPAAIDAPGDVFYFDCDAPGRQVHRSLYPPIPGGPFAADPALVGTGDDASETGPGADRFYVDAAGVPWALSLGDGTVNLPAERQDIAVVLPDILLFASGSGGLDFWHHPQDGAYVFTGSPPPLPFAPFGP